MSAPDLPLPKGFRREITVDGVRIQRSWRESGKLALTLVFTVAWDGSIYFWYAQELAKPDKDWGSIAFGLPHTAIGIFLTYACVASLYNITDLRITPDSLIVTTGPVPWHREIRLIPAEIRSVFYREHANRGYSSTYSVVIVAADGKERRLFKSLDEYEAALFYVHQIRSALGLPDAVTSPYV